MLQVHDALPAQEGSSPARGEKEVFESQGAHVQSSRRRRTMDLSAQKLRVVTVKAGVAVAYRVVRTTWHRVTLQDSGYTNSATSRLKKTDDSSKASCHSTLQCPHLSMFQLR